MPVTEACRAGTVTSEEKGPILQKLLLTALFLCAAQAAHAADAGKIIFVAGHAQAGGSTAREGIAVQEGQMLSTGRDGFIYVKTVDNGLFILRPNTRARIVTYHIDQKNPSNTRIKLELLNGVARSKSGEAVKLARQNFRFNTPVAAIGVRGTDFTVFTDEDTSRVAVISGGVVVSGFTGACRPDGAGPCEGEASRELSAAQRGQLVQVRRGQAAQVMQSSPLSPDLVSPPRPDEPVASHTQVVPATNTSVEASRNAGLTTVIEKNVGAPAPALPVPPEVVVVPGTPATPSVPDAALPERGIVWGRWQPILANPAVIDLSAERKKSELLALNGSFALFRTAGKDYVAPNNGSVGFALKDGEAHIYSDYGYGNIIISAGELSNGELKVDFGRRTFATGIDLTSGGQTTRLSAGGTVTTDGRLYGDAAEGRIGVMNMQGILGKGKDGEGAAYIFDARLDRIRTVNGATSWR